MFKEGTAKAIMKACQGVLGTRMRIEVKFQELHIAITPRTVTPHEEENLVASFSFLRDVGARGRDPRKQTDFCTSFKIDQTNLLMSVRPRRLSLLVQDSCITYS